MLSGVGDLPCDNLELAASMWTASEGEAIKLNIGRQSTMYKEFFDTGHFKNKSYRFSKLFNKDKVDDVAESSTRVLLFDATDSGLSIDNIIEIKEYLFKSILNDNINKNKKVFIVCSANSYEMCKDNSCFDVYSGEYIEFKNYEDYGKYIIKSRKQKDKRFN